MAQDQGQERTEQPTAKRRTEARSRGQVAKSPDLTAAAALLAGVILLHFFGLHLFNRLVGATRFYLGAIPATLSTEQLDVLEWMALRTMLETAMPFMAITAFGVLVVLYVQVGPLFTTKPLELKLSKLNPISGLKRLFGLSSLVKLGMSLLKTFFVAWVAYATLSKELGAIVGSSGLAQMSMLGLGARLVYSLSLRVGVVLLILALLDYAYQRWKHTDGLKMTKQEIKEELRQMEGDPIIKRRQRRVQMELAIQRIRSAVPKADVVVTNPTELAIALRYNSETMSAPKVVAKGRGFLARRIREIAIEAGVPIVQRKALAQAMYKMVEVGQEIPPQFYKTIAEILSFVYELAGKGRRRAVSPAGA